MKHKYVMTVTVPMKDIDKYHFGTDWKCSDKGNEFSIEFYTYNNHKRELRHVIRDLAPFVFKDTRYLLIHEVLWNMVGTNYTIPGEAKWSVQDEYGANVWVIQTTV